MDNDENIYTVPLDFLYRESTNRTQGRLFLNWQRPNNPGGDNSVLYNQRMIQHQLSFLKGPVFVKTPDIIENLYQGMYSNRVQEIDTFTRDSNDHFYDYQENFRQSAHLAPEPIEIDSRFEIDDDNRPMCRTIISSDGVFSQENHLGKIENTVSGHISKIQQTKNIILNGVIPGSFSVRTGQKWSFDVPKQSDGSTEDMGLQEIDERYSGTYLISGIAHEFAQNGNYSMSTEFFRDSLSRGNFFDDTRISP